MQNAVNLPANIDKNNLAEHIYKGHKHLHQFVRMKKITDTHKKQLGESRL